MRLFGLIGYPLDHTFSPWYFSKKFEKEGIDNCEYRAFPISELDQLTKLLAEYPELEGLNVTKPYKQMVLNYMNVIDGEAYNVGAVNTIKITHQEVDFHLKGFNTDIYGYRESLRKLLKPVHEQALILGSGGASKAIQYVLDALGVNYKMVSRKPGENRITYEELSNKLIAESKLIINATPIGSYPRNDEAPPIPYEAVGSDHLLYDLVYNPPKTKFMEKGLEQGAVVKNGQEMLELQAEKSWEIWNNPEV